MKKLIVASVAAMVALAPASAMAGDDAAYLLGGIVGGMVLGGIFNNHHDNYNRYEYQQPVYAAPPPTYRCEWIKVRRWDPYSGRYYYTTEQNCFYQ
jgi:hypothetical protein